MTACHSNSFVDADYTSITLVPPPQTFSIKPSHFLVRSSLLQEIYQLGSVWANTHMTPEQVLLSIKSTIMLAISHEA